MVNKVQLVVAVLTCVVLCSPVAFAGAPALPDNGVDEDALILEAFGLVVDLSGWGLAVAFSVFMLLLVVWVFGMLIWYRNPY